jgi:putative FmdB family regulatory protein
MPIYSYKCKNCAHTFDINQALSDDALSVCPECKGLLIKVFGQVGVSFKGSGFYINDSGSAKPAAKKSGE